LTPFTGTCNFCPPPTPASLPPRPVIPQIRTIAYTDDLAGNRTAVRANGALIANLSYNDANQVIGWSYDAAGNLLSDGTTTRSYDALNRLVAQAEEGRSMLRLQRRRRPGQRRHDHLCTGSRCPAQPGTQ